MASFKCHGKEIIRVNVDIDSELTPFSCFKILENILKYILYQRCQIPLPYDVLCKEFQQNDVFENRRDSPCNAGYSGCADQYSLQIHQSKEEVLQKKKERKKRQRLQKIKTLLDSFHRVTEVLHSELKSGNMTAVRFLLGHAISSKCEIYTILLPASISTSHIVHSKQDAIMQFFRAFVTNEDLVNLISRPCSIKKLWVMFEKKDFTSLLCNDSSSNNTAKSLASSETAHSKCIPHPEFKPNSNSQMIEVLVHVKPQETPMEFTPSVGSGVIDYMCTSLRKISTKRSLQSQVTNSTKRFSSEAKIHRSLQCACSLEEDIPEHTRNNLDHSVFEASAKSYQYGTLGSRSVHCHRQRTFLCKKCQNSCVNHLTFSPYTPKLFKEENLTSDIDSFYNTEASENESEVTNSPSKFLVSKIDRFKICDDSENLHHSFNQRVSNADSRMWYSIDYSIRGFKDSNFIL
ncbi:hypothetical protein SK128_000183 [Halocaridina rubra]|uniref:Uncharacterized protein n=1 Tax=Halocaridina rubra TaxID=373956 RepID=A0AAN8X528_HALRR